MSSTKAESAALQIFKHRVEKFKRAIQLLSKTYGLSISHEDTHGAFIITGYDEDLDTWFQVAHEKMPKDFQTEGKAVDIGKPPGEEISDVKSNWLKPIPTSLESAIDRLMTNLGGDFLEEEVRKVSEKQWGATTHRIMGRILRNQWRLWAQSPLSKWFEQYDIYHADDKSGIILTSLHRRANARPLKLKEQVKECHDYWKDKGVSIEQQKQEYQKCISATKKSF